MILDPVVDLNSVFFSGSNVINYFNVEQPSKEHVKDFFTKKLQNNDVVFIRFEKLGLEEENGLLSGFDDAFEINKTSLCGNTEDPFTRNWDMIGLIDGVRSSYSAGSTDRFVNIQGRDLTKLLIEDASYFIPVKFIEGSDKRFIWGGNEEDSWYKRNMISGSYDYYFAYTMKEFKTAIGFIVNHLSNLGVVPDELFSSYGDKISKVKDIPTQDVNYIVDKKVKGIWQIIKFFVDPAIEFRRIADDSLANPDGTLFEYIKKLCQEPFVEFWGDTNGDTYDFILRQPPFTKEAIQGVAKEGKYITIENKDLYNYDFDFDERFYSFYQIEPENTFLGEDKNSMLAYIPIIYFNQIAETFGNKRLIVKDNYISMRALTGGDVNLNFDIFISTLLPDYKFVIDTNHYLPFTRKGSITINGDRRIKRGTFIRLEATDELFYVTDVSHSLSIGRGKIDRTTTIQVERGMVFDYILGKSLSSDSINKQARFNKATGKVETTQKYFNYFNIVDTQLIYDTIVQNVNQNKAVGGGSINQQQGINSTPTVFAQASRIKETVKTKFGINEEIFDFFLTRKQFD
jgi:hypothetical protein